MATYTKGPWKLETDSRSDDGSALEITDGAGGYTIATCVFGDTGVRDVEEAEGNARLISVAPDMLDLLRLAVEDPVALGLLPSSPWLENVQAAIATVDAA